MLPSHNDRPLSISTEFINYNPYIIPSDDQIFRIRDEERKLNRDTKSRLNLCEKSKSDVLSFTARLREIVGERIYIQIVYV